MFHFLFAFILSQGSLTYSGWSESNVSDIFASQLDALDCLAIRARKAGILDDIRLVSHYGFGHSRKLSTGLLSTYLALDRVAQAKSKEDIPSELLTCPRERRKDLRGLPTEQELKDWDEIYIHQQQRLLYFAANTIVRDLECHEAGLDLVAAAPLGFGIHLRGGECESVNGIRFAVFSPNVSGQLGLGVSTTIGSGETTQLSGVRAGGLWLGLLSPAFYVENCIFKGFCEYGSIGVGVGFSLGTHATQLHIRLKKLARNERTVIQALHGYLNGY